MDSEEAVCIKFFLAMRAASGDMESGAGHFSGLWGSVVWRRASRESMQ